MLKPIIFGLALLLTTSFGAMAQHHAAPAPHAAAPVPHAVAPHAAPVPHANPGNGRRGWDHGHYDHHHGWWHGRECWFWLGPICVG